MEFFQTSIAFISEEVNNLLPTGDFSIWIIALLLMLFISALFMFLFKWSQILNNQQNKKHGLLDVINNRKTISIIFGFVIAFILISASVIYCSSQLGYADSGKFVVTDNVEINLDENQSVYSSAQTIDNQSDYAYCIDKLLLENAEGIKDKHNWSLAINGTVIYNAEAGQEIQLQNPLYIPSKQTANVEISSDMSIDDAKKLGNKNIINIVYGVCKLGKITNMKIDDKIKPNDVDNNILNFSWVIDNNNQGFSQSAFNIIVKSISGEIIFDSGQVSDSEKGNSNNVSYQIYALTSLSDYTWELTLWDNFGNKLDSASSKFSTAYLSSDVVDPLGNAQYLSYDDPRLKDDNDRHTQNFTIDYDLIMEKNPNSPDNHSKSNFGFSVLDNKNYFYLHLEQSNDDKLIYNFARRKDGVTTSFDPYKFDGLVFSEQIQDKKIHVQIVSEYNSSTKTQTITPKITLEGEKKYDGVSYTPEDGIYLYKIGIPSLIRRWSISEYTSRITNIDVKNTSNNLNKQVYFNDFSSGRLGFYHEYTARLDTDEQGQTWIKLGYNVPDGNWVEEPLIEYNNKEGNLPVFRTTFNTGQRIASAKLFTTGLGAYDCYINGSRVYNQTDNAREYYELKNNYTQKDFTQYYLTFDVTSMICNGNNAISAVVSDSWWSDKVTAYWGKEDAFKCELVITYVDGTKKIVDTNTNTWKAAPASPICRGDIFSGETYDDNFDMPWTQVGFDDSGWYSPKVNNESTIRLSSWKGEKITVREDLNRNVKSNVIYKGSSGAIPDVRYGHVNVLREPTTNSFELNPGETALIDFGQNGSGWENFSALSEYENTKLTIKHAEVINVGNGEISKANFGPGGSALFYNIRSAYATTELFLAANKQCDYHPSLTFYGFRYIEITANNHVTISNVSASTLTSVKTDTSTFESDSPLINKLYSNAKWGMYSNYLGVPTDCPQRDERQGWTADAQTFIDTALILGDNKGFLEKFCRDMTDARQFSNEHLAFGATAPESGSGLSYVGAAGWADAGVIIPYTLYNFFGDVRVLESAWSSMDEYVGKWIPTQTTDDHMGPTITLGDWHVPDQAYLNRDEIKHVVACEYYLWDLQIMINTAKILGKDYETSYYENIYKNVKDWFNNKYCSGDALIYSESQTLAAYALYLDLIDNPSVRDNTINNLVQNIHGFGNKLKTGFLGTRVLLDALVKVGQHDLAYQILLSDGNPSWLLSVVNGGTTFWERWDSYTEEYGFYHIEGEAIDWTNSFNHYAYGGVVAWIYRNLLGINYDTNNPGYKKIIINPYPCRVHNKEIFLNNAKGSFDTNYGTVSASSNYSDSQWIYSFTTPTNTSAVLKMPKLNFNKFFVNGIDYKSLNFERDGISFVNEDDEYIEFDISNGSFEVNFSLS